MTPFQQFGLATVQWVQGWGDWLAPLMQGLSATGRSQFYLVIMPLLYWCVDSSLGLQVAVMLLLSSSVNDMLKMLLRQPRPYWLHPIGALSYERSFGLPSGHSQQAMSVWGLLALRGKSRSLALILGVAIAGIGLSRLYLGVHFPTDVLLGWLVGALLLILFVRWQPAVTAWWRERTLRTQVICSLLAALLLLGLPALAYGLTAGWQMPVTWQQNILAQFGEIEDPRTLEGAWLVSGLMLGLGIGRALMNRCGGFATDGPAVKRLLRYLLGIVGLGLLWFGLGALIPDTQSLPLDLLRWLHAAVLGLWVAVGAPLCFLRLGLTHPLSPKAKRQRQ